MSYKILDQLRLNSNITIYFSILFLLLIFVIVTVYRYILIWRRDQKRLNNLLQPLTTTSSNLSCNKEDVLTSIKHFATTNHLIYQLKIQDHSQHKTPFLYTNSTIFITHTSKNMFALHSYLEKVMTRDYHDFNATNYGFKTFYELEHYLKRSYYWRNYDRARSLYYFSIYFEGVIVICSNLVQAIADNYEGRSVESAIMENRKLRDKYHKLVHKYRRFGERGRRGLYSPYTTRVGFIYTYGVQMYEEDDCVEIERCFVTYVVKFYERMDQIYNEIEITK